MRNLLKLFKKEADEIVSEVDKSVKLLTWIAYALSAGFAAGFFAAGLVAPTIFEPLRPVQPVTTEYHSAAAALFSEIQAAYSAEIEPVRARWIEVTRELERPNLLPSEYEKKLASQDVLRGEIERMETERAKARDSIAQACSSR